MRQSTFEQVENPKYKTQYSDRKLHTKYAMRDMWRRKYGTVGELNAAWTEAWGHPTGGEDRDYGDFISVVRKAHASVVQRLREEMGAAVSR